MVTPELSGKGTKTREMLRDPRSVQISTYQVKLPADATLEKLAPESVDLQSPPTLPLKALVPHEWPASQARTFVPSPEIETPCLKMGERVR